MLQTKILELKQLLMAEASLVEKMVTMSIDGLQNGYPEALKEVLTFEMRVNTLEVEIENKCTATIALYQPEAHDLRLILMIYKINNDLERLGDQAVNIAESADQLQGSVSVRELPELALMKTAALSMLKKALDGFAKEDTELAKQVCHMDDTVDDLNRGIYKHLVELLKARPDQTTDYLHLLRIAKNLERIGDLSTNIAENTIYLAVGRVIKHQGETED